MPRLPLVVAVAAAIAASSASSAAAQTGIRFNGTSQYVTFGSAPSLGASSFTLEVWFKRDGTGIGANTGTGGHAAAVPLIAKGRGEADGDNRDMNYFLGVRASDGVLVADYEEGSGQTSPGLNHPIAGVTPTQVGVWYHAAATFDGRVWRLYLNGNVEKDTTLSTNRKPRSNSIQHASLASALTSTGVAQGFFRGTLDEPRIWNRARTQQAIKDSMGLALSTAPGLIGRWALDAISGTTTPTSIAGGVAGTVVGGAATAAGAPLGGATNRAPGAPSQPSPADQATQVATAASLATTVSDPDGNALTVTFYGRVAPAAPGPDFTLIGMPDTQYYTSSLNGGSPAIMESQTNWIVANRAARNIVAVVQLGDCTQNGDNGGNPVEWDYADHAFKTIENPTTTQLAAGIPYGVCVGNHDQSPAGNADGTTTFYNQYFGETRFRGRSYYGGHYGANNDNHYELFSASGLDFILICLEYDTTPDAAVLAWADNLLATYSQRRAIVASHYLINSGNPGSFGTQGQAVYNALRARPNLFLMLCGHVTPPEGRRSDTYNGRTVHTLLSDYQDRTNGGNGWLRIYEFSPAKNVIRARTYSPWLSQFETDADSSSQFTLPYDMSGGSAFQTIAVRTGVASGTRVTVPWAGLQPSQTYEWYAVVQDASVTTTGPTWRFTTASVAPTLAHVPLEPPAADAGALAFAAAFRPNPSQGAGALELTTTRAGWARAALFDASGRRVKSLIDTSALSAGRHRLVLAGDRLAPGIYFYRVEAAEGVLGGKVVLVD